jgi:hypothetical protein
MCANGSQLPVGEISRMRAQGVRIRMGSDERRVADGHNVPEPAFIEVRQVDQNSQPVAGGDQPFTEVGQARPGIGRRRTKKRHAMAERIRPAPDRTEGAQSGRV